MTMENDSPLPSPLADILKARPYAVVFTAKSKAIQSFKESSDVNNIVSQFEKTGLWHDPLNPPTRRPMTGDFSNIGTFQEAQNVVAQGREYFESLPSDIRSRFQNDPGLLLAFLDDPDNRKEAEKLGLLESSSSQEPSLSPLGDSINSVGDTTSPLSALGAPPGSAPVK